MPLGGGGTELRPARPDRAQALRQARPRPGLDLPVPRRASAHASPRGTRTRRRLPRSAAAPPPRASLVTAHLRRRPRRAGRADRRTGVGRIRAAATLGGRHMPTFFTHSPQRARRPRHEGAAAARSTSEGVSLALVPSTEERIRRSGGRSCRRTRPRGSRPEPRPRRSRMSPTAAGDAADATTDPTKAKRRRGSRGGKRPQEAAAPTAALPRPTTAEPSARERKARAQPARQPAKKQPERRPRAQGDVAARRSAAAAGSAADAASLRAARRCRPRSAS